MTWGTSVIGLADAVEDLGDMKSSLDGTAVYTVGTNVEYALWLEIGTSRMPAYPWFRPAIRQVMREKADEIADDSGSVDELVKRIALELERQMKQNVSAARGSGRSPGTDPDHPTRQSSNLVGSIEAERIR